MALTSLESISEKLAETKKANLEALLITSGSAAVAKNEFGVTVVDNTNVASSLVFKNLSKPKYDETELLKAIDVEVIELKPNIPTPNLNLIPKPLYDEQVLLVEDLRKQVARLTTTIEDLNAQIITLQTQVQTEINNRLSVEQTNDVLVNQIDTLTNTINDFSNQIAISLQKSVDESILRASLQSQKTGFKAQIEALIQQINSLNAIIEGLQAQLGAVRQQKDLEATAQSQGGAIINKIVTANFSPKGSANDAVMGYKIKNARDRAKEWVYGKNLKLVNNDLEPVTVTLTTKFRAESITTFGGQYKSDQAWFKAPKESFKITAGSTEEITFIETPEKIIFSKRQNTEFFDGVLNIKVTRADGTSDSKDFKTRLKIAHPKSYEGF
jgi:predicted  nucleic acid-binding Zn-ribbon protein